MNRLNVNLCDRKQNKCIDVGIEVGIAIFYITIGGRGGNAYTNDPLHKGRVILYICTF